MNTLNLFLRRSITDVLTAAKVLASQYMEENTPMFPGLVDEGLIRHVKAGLYEQGYAAEEISEIEPKLNTWAKTYVISSERSSHE